MGQREDVTASLLASHGVDAVARRKVAEKVKAVVIEGATRVAGDAASEAGYGFAIEIHPSDVATAASAVVLASDLRAPSDDPAEMERQVHPAILLHPDGRTEMAQPHMCPDWRARLANVERLLAYTDETDEPETVRSLVCEAMDEIRAMMDGE